MRPWLIVPAFLTVLALAPAQARWKAEYAAAAPEVQDWYRNAKLTEAARKRFAFQNCCDHADVVRTEFRVSKTTAGDEWWWLDGSNGTPTWRQIPPDIIHWGEHAPDGRPTLFVYSGLETCFYPGDSGI